MDLNCSILSLFVDSLQWIAGRQIADTLCQRPGAEDLCHAAQLDVSDPQSIRAFIAEVTGGDGKQITGLINNAGVFLSGWSAQLFDISISTNFRGPLDLALGLAPHMSKGEHSIPFLPNPRPHSQVCRLVMAQHVSLHCHPASLFMVIWTYSGFLRISDSISQK